ncbi:DNA-binding protein [Xanthomonas cissicola]|uniref:DNA-binding protein n=1 Tax=Xanthomonas cissicola TaxID=86186 RepID=UPI003F6E0B1B
MQPGGFSGATIEVAEEVAAVTKALTERLASLAVELNDKAVKAAERRFAEVIRTAGEQREQSERELADASQTVEDLESKLDETKAEAEVLQSKLVDVQAAHQAQAVELAKVRERLALAEQTAKAAAQEHAAELAERDQARADLATVKAKAEVAEQVAKAAAQEHATTLAERDAACAELVKAQAKAEAAEQAQQEQRKAAATEAHRQAERYTVAQAERDEALKATADARENAAKLAGQLEAVQAQNAALLARLTPPPAGDVPPASAKGGTQKKG